ncbi:MAG: hypothetical protein ACPG5P_02210 [Saprospiraceae bacterium]
MTKAEFFQQLDRSSSTLQVMAVDMTNDKASARELYLETLHHAIQQRTLLEQLEGFKSWLVKLMNDVFSNKM